MINYEKKIKNDVFWLLLSILSLSSILLIFISTKNYGVGVSPDSTVYINAAKQIINGETINLVMWPPFYPAALALCSKLFNSQILDTARIMNAVLFGLTIFVSGILFKRNLRSSSVILVLGIMTVIISVPLFQVHLWAWSEPLFILFSTLFLLFIDNYVNSKKFIDLILSAICVSFCCFTRYVGIAYILVGIIILIIIFFREIKKMLRNLFYFTTTSVIPIALWLYRNKLYSGTFTGPRAPSIHTYSENFRAMGNSILNWYIPARVEMNRLLLALLFIIIGFFIGIYFIKAKPKGINYFVWQYPYIIYIVIYSIFLVASSPSYQQLIDSRYLSPILIPLNILLVFYILEISKIFEGILNNNKAFLLKILIMISFLVVPFLRAKSSIMNQIDQGIGYTAKVWEESETIEFLESNSLNCAIYSNGADVIYFLSGEQVNSLPRKNSGSIEIATLTTISSEWPIEEKVCIVWFDNITWRDYFFTPEELLQISKVEDETQLADGTIYLISEGLP